MSHAVSTIGEIARDGLIVSVFHRWSGGGCSAHPPDVPCGICHARFRRSNGQIRLARGSVEKLPALQNRGLVPYNPGTTVGRRQPPKEVRDRILAEQENKCLYCEHEFGSPMSYRSRPGVLAVAWDHRIPYAYLQANPDSNWVAACRPCNGIKSAKMFNSVVEAQEFILPRRFVKGYRP